MQVINWREFAPGIYSAGQPEPGLWPRIREAGVRTVLNLRPDSEQPGIDESRLVEAAGLHYLHLPVESADAIDANCIATFNELLGSHAGEPLLIHCASGNRVGALVALRAHRFLGESPARALAVGEQAGLAASGPRVKQLMGDTESAA